MANPKAGGGRKKNAYNKPKAVKQGTVLTDTSKQSWKIGPSIGSGGFGDIYSACRADQAPKKADDYQYVVKIEPHGNGPLFVEMHFYMRNAKLEDIENFQRQHGLKSLGMPNFIGSGSHDLDGVKHRFVVMPRYGRDVWSLFLANGRRIPPHTIYRLALQMLDVYEYIHGCGYVHGDLKGSNMMLGFGRGGDSQAFLLDFGLASHYTNGTVLKPDPKKAHNGTIEYTSRDAHIGVPTMRGDLEILGFNLVHWNCGTLPWEAEKLLTDPVKVQASKERHMGDIGGFMRACYGKEPPPAPIYDFLKYVASLKFDQKPDYNKCRKYFLSGLSALGAKNVGPLQFTGGAAAKKAQPQPGPSKRKISLQAAISDTEEDEEPDLVAPTPPAKANKRGRPTKQAVNYNENDDEEEDEPESPEAIPKKRGRPKSTPEAATTPSKRVVLEGTPVIKVESATKSKGGKKIYNVNLNLDVSLDADVIVNVNRKRTKKDEKAKASPAKENGKAGVGRARDSLIVIDDSTDADDSFVAPDPIRTPPARKGKQAKTDLAKKKLDLNVPTMATGRAGEYKGKKAKTNN